MTVTSTVTVVPSPSPTQSPKTVDTSHAIVIAAIISVCGIVLTGVVTWLVGRRSVRAAERSADAAERSAQAAQDAVNANRESAAALAIQAEADAFSARYQNATAQLGHEQAQVRIAGVYAMASLADDWSAQRQACVDLLCAYLRRPPRDELVPYDTELDVRQVVCRILSERLQRTDLDEPGLWSSCRIDLDGAVLMNLKLDSAIINNRFSMDEAVLRGSNQLDDIVIMRNGSVSMRGLRLDGYLSIDGVVCHGPLYLGGLHVTYGSRLHVDVRFPMPNRPLVISGMKVEGAAGISIPEQSYKVGPHLSGWYVEVAGSISIEIVRLPETVDRELAGLDFIEWRIHPGAQLVASGCLEAFWSSLTDVDGNPVSIRWSPTMTELEPEWWRDDEVRRQLLGSETDPPWRDAPEMSL